MPTAEESLSAFDSEEDTPFDAAPRLFIFESEPEAALDLRVVRPVAPSSAPAPGRILQIEPDLALQPAAQFRPPSIEPPRPPAPPAPLGALGFRRVLAFVIMSALAAIGGYLLSANMERSEQPRAAIANADRMPSAASDAPAPPQNGNRAALDDEARRPSAATPWASATAPSDVKVADSAVASPTPAGRQTVAATGSPAPPPVNGPAEAGPHKEFRPRVQAPIEEDVPSAMTTVPASPTEPPDDSADSAVRESAEDLNGWWSVTTRVETASIDAFKDLTLGYRLQLEQRGNHVVGAGYKLTEDGRTIASGGRTPINVEGTLEGDRLTLNFTEQGTRRTSGGRFVLYMADDGSFRGRFKSDAAQSSGSSIATRESSGRD